MNGLPPEMLALIAGHTDRATVKVLACTSLLWRALVQNIGVPKRQLSCRATPGGACLLHRRCAIRYAEHMITMRRWNVLAWMVGETLPFGGLNNVDKRACEAAAADGNLEHLNAFAARGYRWDSWALSKVAARHGRSAVFDWIEGKGYDWRIYGIHAEIAKGGYIDFLKQAQQQGHQLTGNVIRCAAEYGHLELLRWLREGNSFWWDEHMCSAAARNGHLDVVEWAVAGGCDWNADVLIGAARHGHMHILEWAHRQHKCYRHDRAIIKAAIKGGRLDIVEWLHRRGYAWGESICIAAATGGHLPLLQWCVANGCQLSAGSMYWGASANGHVHVMEWLLAQGHALDPIWQGTISAHVAERGQLGALKWLRERGHCAWDARTCLAAAENGHLHVLQWAVTNGCSWTESVCTFVAQRGDLDMLRWLRANGCPWDAAILAAAARSRSFDVVEWCAKQGCPWNAQANVELAQWDNSAGLRLARERGCPWDAGVCTALASRGDLQTLQWARANGCPWDERVCSVAAQNRHYSVLRWAHENGCPWSAEVYRALSVCGSDPTALQWAIERGCPTTA